MREKKYKLQIVSYCNVKFFEEKTFIAFKCISAYIIPWLVSKVMLILVKGGKRMCCLYIINAEIGPTRFILNTSH